MTRRNSTSAPIKQLVLVALMRPIVVATTADHEFDLVVGLRVGNIVPKLRCTSASPGLYIQHDDSGIHSVYRERAAGFQRPKTADPQARSQAQRRLAGLLTSNSDDSHCGWLLGPVCPPGSQFDRH